MFCCTPGASGGQTAAWSEDADAPGLTGWRGPAKVVAVKNNGGLVHINYKGNAYECRNRDARHALLYFAHCATLAYHIRGPQDKYDNLASYVESMAPEQHRHLDFYTHEKSMVSPKGSQYHYLLLFEALGIAQAFAGLTNCVGACSPYAVDDIHKLPVYMDSAIWHWNKPSDISECNMQIYHSHQLHLHSLAPPHTSTHTIQFLLPSKEATSDLLEQHPSIQNLDGRNNIKHQTRKRNLFTHSRKTDDAPTSQTEAVPRTDDNDDAVHTPTIPSLPTPESETLPASESRRRTRHN